MRRKEEPHKACDNCKHFTMHYQRYPYNYYVALKCGKCIMRNFTEEERAKLPYNFVCDNWAPKPDADTDIYEIKEELRDITAKLILIVKALSK